MEVKFPQRVDYKYFYRFSLKKIISFLNFPAETVLIIDMQDTDYMKPSILCDLLSSFNLIRIHKDANIYLKFGRNKRLPDYLSRTGFFLHSNYWQLFATDLMSMETEISSSRQARNTDKVWRIDIPKHNPNSEYKNLDMPQAKSREIQDCVNRAFFQMKQKGYRNGQYGDGISFIDEVSRGYIEIVENSYEHSNLTDYVEHSYYTFQNYANTGFFFANSDLGCGFFRSLMKKKDQIILDMSRDGKNQEEIQKQVADFQKKLLFTPEEYAGFQSNRALLNCAAIVEGIAFRITEGKSLIRGIPYILSRFVLSNNGIFMLHNENVMLEIDRDFVNEFFIVSVDSKGELAIDGYRREALRSIVFSQGVWKSLICKGNLRIFDYTFPGVHMAVEVCGGQK